MSVNYRRVLRVTSTKVVHYLKIYYHRRSVQLTHVTLLDTSITALVGKSWRQQGYRHHSTINLSFIIKKQANKPLQLYNYNIYNSHMKDYGEVTVLYKMLPTADNHKIHEICLILAKWTNDTCQTQALDRIHLMLIQQLNVSVKSWTSSGHKYNV
jgi:hypothetical protein